MYESSDACVNMSDGVGVWKYTCAHNARDICVSVCEHVERESVKRRRRRRRENLHCPIVSTILLFAE